LSFLQAGVLKQLYVQRFWRVRVRTDRIFAAFRARFAGRASAIHFVWGVFNLTVTS